MSNELPTERYTSFELASVMAPNLSNEQLLTAFRSGNVAIAKTYIDESISDTKRKAVLDRYYDADRLLSSELIKRVGK